MTDTSVQQLSFSELKAALAQCNGSHARRHSLRRECLRRIERCNCLVYCTGGVIVAYVALGLLLSQ